MQYFNFEGQTALVTGASSGLGKQFALLLASAGADVAIAARREDKLKEVAEEIEALGRKALILVMDVTKEEEIAAGFAKIKKEWQKLDIVVNNAGISSAAPAEEMSFEDWQRVVDVNLTGVFLVAKHAGALMKEKKYGRIINLASIYGLVGNSAFNVANYHATKGAVVNLTRALAAEWAKYQITVNAIGPGFFESEMTGDFINTDDFKQYVAISCPMKRVGKKGELNTALLFLADKASSYVTGQTIAVDGGWTAI
ncbi:MAG TPA: SDR family oxidoreductase [Candidatus Woesebacteria bacterium]|jgi:gluconate 5-dehydrogenase|nr:SDR family oxidoreductase [Candidatus Woesebacteria bacterium]HOA11840.1 SDR family oxidoreductase [Candidatus Woesebacteria bacterium]HOC07472.1 SDR family oxidoreductase [Candidatus Woesebacteria bacterium]HOI05041.1 SDR family oxidoreductase [Candidatus Woesebacteria bacterium]HOP39147.1 SDR family oxidoreductase [Candidatus Woesebacteria bacterium]